MDYKKPLLLKNITIQLQLQTNGWYKIKILSTSSWTLCFTIRVYQTYSFYDIVVGGYQYGSNYWYMPNAKLIT